MARAGHWDVDVTNLPEMWIKLIGQPEEDPEITIAAANKLFFERGNRCLEIGAGVGRLLWVAVDYYNEALGVDISPSLIHVSKRYLLGNKRASIVLGDGYSLPFPDEMFDFVYSFTCFQHMEELEMIRSNLREAFRVLKPGGVFRFQTVIGKRDSGRHDGYVFESPEELEKEMLVGFTEKVWYLEGEWVWMTARKA